MKVALLRIYTLVDKVQEAKVVFDILKGGFVGLWIATYLTTSLGTVPDSHLHAKEAFLLFAQEAVDIEKRAMALAYAAQLNETYNEALFEEPARFGNGLACAAMSRSLAVDADSSFEWARRSAQKGDPRGLFLLAQCYEYGKGCSLNTGRALELYKQSADLGESDAITRYGKWTYDADDPMRYLWYGKAVAANGQSYKFFRELLFNLEMFDDVIFGVPSDGIHAWRNRIAPVISMFGRVCKELGFEHARDDEERRAMLRVIRLHDTWCSRARDSVLTWRLVARRLGLINDVAWLIAVKVWEGRYGDACHYEDSANRGAKKQKV